MLSDYTIINAGVEFSTIFAEVHKQCFAHAWSQDSFARFLALSGAQGLLAVSPQGQDGEFDKPVGFALMTSIKEEGELLTFGVLPQYRRAGIGTRLLDKCHDFCTQQGAGYMFLEVNVEDAGAVSFYMRAGYEKAGIRPHYYHRSNGPAEDALIMSHDLEKC